MASELQRREAIPHAETIFPKVFQMEKGDIFSTTSAGLEQTRKIYGEFGYIDFVPARLRLTRRWVDRPQSFGRRRQAVLSPASDFQGNTTTRDKVIRRNPARRRRVCNTLLGTPACSI